MLKLNDDNSMKLDQQIYQDLTTIFKMFKRKLLLKQNNKYISNQEVQQVRAELKDIIYEQYKIIEKYQQVKSELIQFRTVFYRFFSRLIELIRKEKARNLSKSTNSLNQYHQILEYIIIRTVNHQKPNYLQALTLICQKTKKYSKIIIFKTLKTTSMQQQSPTKSICRNPDFLLDVSCKSIVQQQQKIIPKLKIHFNKTFQISTTEKPRSFIKAVDCLDIQLYDFRSQMLSLKSNPNQSIQQQLSRNIYIQKQIKQYSKKYSIYQMKLNKKQKISKYASKQQSISNIQGLNNSFLKMNMDTLDKQPPDQKIQSKTKSRSIKNIFKQNDITYKRHFNFDPIKTMNNFTKMQKVSLMATSSPKKTMYSFNKVSLKPFLYQSAKKPQNYVNLRRKLKTLGNSPKKNPSENSEIIIQGKKIHESQIRKRQYKMLTQKNIISHHFNF